MPELTIEVQEVKGLSGTALVVLDGSIDAKTVITFQTHLNSVKTRGINRFILDMEKVKYVNSTGLGYLINLSDSVQTSQGAISLVKVQPKVKVVFDMLGLNAFFKIYNTRDDALKSISATAGAEAPAAEAAAKSKDQTVVMEAQKPGVRPSRPESTTTRPLSMEDTSVVDSQTKPAAGATRVACKSCKADLAVRDVGTYKCPRCFTLFNYVGGGKASFLPRRKAVPIQLSLSFSQECTKGLLEFVRIFANRSGFQGGQAQKVQKAVEEMVDTIKKKAYGGNENNLYHVLLLSNDSEIEMRLADYGASISPQEANSKLFTVTRETMDRFELKNHPKGGNILSVSKKKGK